MPSVIGGYAVMKQPVLGTVRRVLPKGLLEVQTDDGRQIVAGLSSRVAALSVRIASGDRVALAPSAYSTARGTVVRHLN